MSSILAMTTNEKNPYKGSLTREQFLFHEMRTTAQLICEGLSDQETVKKIHEENLFQYPTERMLKNLASVCVNRLHAMNDDYLVQMIANRPSNVAKQVCLYAIMKHNRLVWDFMITVVGEKYRLLDMSFSKLDLNTFFMRLQEQNDNVASWSESSITKIKQVLVRILVENEYLDSTKSDHLNPVLIDSELRNAIISNNDDAALPAFNCFM